MKIVNVKVSDEISHESQSSECLCNLEPEAPINHMNVVRDSGLLFVAAEQPRILSYFIPSISRRSWRR